MPLRVIAGRVAAGPDLGRGPDEGFHAGVGGRGRGFVGGAGARRTGTGRRSSRWPVTSEERRSGDRGPRHGVHRAYRARGPRPAAGGTAATTEVFALVTDLLDVEEYPALDLACCFPERWLRGRHRPSQDGHGRGPAGPAVEGPRRGDAGNGGAFRRIPRPQPARPHQPPLVKEVDFPRPQAGRAQRQQRRPENRVPPAQPLADHLKQGHWRL